MQEIPELNVEKNIEVFLENILPDNASEVQIVESRKCFIAGMFQNYINMMAISSFSNEKEAERSLEKLSKDLKKSIDKYINL